MAVGHGLRRRAGVRMFSTPAAKRILPQRGRKEKNGVGFLADAGILRVFGDADDLHPASLELEAPAERACGPAS